jgi:hypothetical protein
MATFKSDEFKFPDEKAAEKAEKVDFEVENEVEVEVVDDTPEDDKNRSPMKEAPQDVTEDELSQYSEGVKQRIKHFSKGYHEERRAKESAQREREEALRLAQNLVEENKKLQTNLGQGQQALLEQAKHVVARELEDAKRKYKEAYEAGDSDALLDAQEQLTSVKIKADKVNNFRPALQQRESSVKTAPRESERPQVDPKANAWKDSNPWFGENKRMTAMALTIHQEIVESGVDPSSDDYYKKLNSEIREVFPDAFSSEKQSRKSSVVAPATRSTAPRKIVLTQSQVNIAKRLGVPLEQYARQVAEEMRKQNG